MEKTVGACSVGSQSPRPPNSKLTPGLSLADPLTLALSCGLRRARALRAPPCEVLRGGATRKARERPDRQLHRVVTPHRQLQAIVVQRRTNASREMCLHRTT